MNVLFLQDSRPYAGKPAASRFRAHVPKPPAWTFRGGMQYVDDPLAHTMRQGWPSKRTSLFR